MRATETGGRELLKLYKRPAQPEFKLTFPDNVAEFVRESYREAGHILEYGSGGSTLLAAQFKKPCLSVESDTNWARLLNERLSEDFNGASTARAVHVDIGPTKAWGYPKDTQHWSEYWRYPMAVWSEPDFHAPNLVLIDGRMRTACFATIMMNATFETCVLFDDYTERSEYHCVEKFIEPDLTVGRMAQFTVRPGFLSAGDFAELLPWFFVLR